MALKAILDSLEDVPEALHSLYVEHDGKFQLDLEGGMVPQDRLREFRDNNIRLMKEQEELKQKLSGYSEIDLKKYESLQKRVQELDDQKMIDEGKIEELLQARTARLVTDYDAQVKAYQKKLSDMEVSHKTLSDELSKERIDGRLRDVATTVGVRKTALQDLINRGRQVWRLVDGEPVAMHGEQTIYGKDPAKPIAMEEWVKGLADDAPHLFELSSGGGAQNNTNGNIRGPRVIDGSDPVVFGKNLADIASGKVEVRRQ